MPSRSTEPWGVVMEIGYPQATVTTVTFIDGTVSVLRSTGGGFFGGGDAGVQEAGRAFLKQARLAQPQMALATDFPAPDVDNVVFYARTDYGVFGASASVAAIQHRGHFLYQLYCAGLRILHEYMRLQKLTQQ